MTKIQFIQQLLKRFERLDRRHVEDYFSILVQEKGMMEIIFNSMLEGVIVSDQEQHIIFINDSAANFLGGYKDQLLKRSLPDFLNQIGLNEVSDYIQGEWGKLIHRDITINYPVPRVLNLNVFPLISANNVQLGLVLLLVDVTRIREEGLESLRSEKLHTISLMAACLAHEIGNPLNSLDIHLQLLHRDMRSLDSSIRDSFTSSVEIIQAEIRRLDEIVRGFLVAARPMKPNLNGVDVNYLVQDVLKTVDTELHTSSIMLQTSLGKDMPKVLLDTNQIKQALFNLVKNA
ncbi:MAG: histidine kinase dimerization/phospho-acceptor domain-containing protein, partial [Chlamydiota bacterium]|nr:histidine kinase dimerization/phospho-acceptor domain-containing protein [Chlamydiota bacterium]